MKKDKVCRIVCEVFREETENIKSLLISTGISRVNIKPSRSIVLKENTGIFRFIAGNHIEEDMLDIISFYIPADSEAEVIDYLLANGKFSRPGNGSVYSENIELLCDENISLTNNSLSPISFTGRTVQKDLVGLTCIVQRGEGNSIAGAALEMGTTVPTAFYGEGTGLRNKLGLIRVTFPAEKEIINFVIAKNEIDDIFDALIDKGKLDQPGMGFIYYYPVSSGVQDTKIFRGKQKHSATMEQLILAMDEVKNSQDWRSRDNGAHGRSSRKYLENFSGLTLVCNEGYADKLIKSAMSAGASGATLSTLRYLNMADKKKERISPARESADMIVPENIIPDIIEAIRSDNSFPDAAAVIEIRPVPKACTFLG
jgi:nitrogen regulatory protein PII